MRPPIQLLIVATVVALGCGGRDRTAPASATPAPASATSTPTAAPTNSTPAPVSTSAPTATKSAAPPTPVVFPASFVAAVNALNALVDKVIAAVKVAKDCNGVADGMNAFTNDPRTPKQIISYFTELALLMPEQTTASAEQNESLASKLSSIGIDRLECAKNPRVKAALKAMSAMEMGAMPGTH